MIDATRFKARRTAADPLKKGLFSAAPDAQYASPAPLFFILIKGLS
ncbi:hypothetical protein [uncultured Desulfovibrio sp.]|nr:hypothetical protein [uncultured Desulfovibrio sp.]